MLMKWLIRLAFPALGLLLVLIFFGLGDPEQVSEAEPGAMEQEIPDFELLVPAPISTDGPEIVFKWRDTDGNWHYADKPPATGQWNALAIEGRDANRHHERPGDPESDWQAPYRAPFSLDDHPANNGS